MESRLYLLLTVAADLTFKDKAYLRVLDARTGKTREKTVSAKRFDKEYTPIADCDPEVSRYLPPEPKFYWARYICEPSVSGGGITPVVGRNGMMIWPRGGSEEKDGVLIPRERFVEFFLPFKEVDAEFDLAQYA